MKRLILVAVLVLMGLVLGGVRQAEAACVPATCDSFGGCNSGEHCVAGCCIADTGPACGGSVCGGWCPAGSSCGTTIWDPGCVCKSDSDPGGPTPPPGDPRCNPGETVVWRSPEDLRCFGSVGACESGNDGIGGAVGTVICDKFGDENCCTNTRPYGCRMGDCVVACSNSAPATPSLSLPAPDANLSSTSVSLVWTHSGSWGTNCSGNNNQFQVYLQTCAPSPAAVTDPSTLLTTVGATTYSQTYTATNGQTYCWKVRATNGILTAPSTARRFTIQNNQITGTVYYDPDASCSTATPQNVGGALSIDWGSNSGVFSGGNYTITTTGIGTNNLVLGNIPAGYTCTPSSAGCNSDGCNVKAGVAQDSTNRHFFLTQSRSAWWQAVGAGVYAGQAGAGVTIRSLLPTSTARLIVSGSVGDEGALMTASSGTPDLGLGAQVSDTNWQAVTEYRGKTMDYQFFAADLISFATPDSWGTSAINQAVYDPAEVIYFSSPAGGTATINAGDPWALTGGQKMVVFVDGDLEINDDVTVDSSSYVAFIVSGEIRVGAGVATIQGHYIADGNFVTESDSSQLDVQGTVVAWGGVSLNRDLGDINISTPAERFTYRPDLLVNMPDELKVFALNWQEVAPGSFD